jgi:hypothetical protein
MFFWSEEHAKEHRHTTERMRGTYMTMEQMIYTTPKVQGGLFAFPRS